jgi:hypothetical protein
MSEGWCRAKLLLFVNVLGRSPQGLAYHRDEGSTNANREDAIVQYRVLNFRH